MNTPGIQLICIANVFTRLMTFEKAGDVEIGHTHNFDHATILAKGKFRVNVSGEISEHVAPKMLYIHKDIIHSIEALEDGAIAACVHALRDPIDGNILSPEQIPAGATVFDKIQPLTPDSWHQETKGV